MAAQDQVAALEKRVKDLESIEGVRDTIAHYSWCVDTEDWPGILEIFAEDGVIANLWRKKDYVGNKAILEFFQQHRAKFKFTNRMSNLNERIRVSGDTATADSYALVMYTINGESRIGWGTYGWKMRREKNVWRVTRLAIDLSVMTTLQRGWGMETGRVLEPPVLGPTK